MTKTNETQPAAADELDNVNLDLVVGGIIVHQATGDTTSARKQEHSEKLA